MEDLQAKRKHIDQLMVYGAPEDKLDAARDLLILFHDDQTGLMVLEEFYSYLPDAAEDWIKELRLVARKAGVFLIGAVTGQEVYLYLVSSEGIEFHGTLAEGFLDNELLDFFGFSDKAGFKKTAAEHEELPLYEAVQGDLEICPACHAVAGQYHELGCPVEVCPWCSGQLIHCGCRFKQLEQEEMGTEEDIIRFEELLTVRGRIAYAPEQRPSFADDGPGVEVY